MSTELRSLYWVGDCGGLTVGIKHTETEPGQFDHIAHETYLAYCPLRDHTAHEYRPVSAAEHDALTADDDEEGAA